MPARETHRIEQSKEAYPSYKVQCKSKQTRQAPKDTDRFQPFHDNEIAVLAVECIETTNRNIERGRAPGEAWLVGMGSWELVAHQIITSTRTKGEKRGFCSLGAKAIIVTTTDGKQVPLCL